MNAAIVLAWDPDSACAWRRRWLPAVHQHIVGFGLPVRVQHGREGAVRNAGVRAARAAGADTFFIWDADSLIPYDRAIAALELAAAAPGLVVPHDRYVQMSRDDSAYHGERTVELLDANGRLPARIIERADWAGPHSVGGPVAFSADTFDAAGGYDETVIHGYDGTFALACAVLAGPGHRLEGDMIHLWHSRPPSRIEDPPETWAALAAYHAAAVEGPSAFSALVSSRGGPWAGVSC